MATKHWARDALITDSTNYIADANHNQGNALLYHFLRNAGWAWIWECDGEVGPGDTDCNHVQDGSMEDPTNPPTYWSVVGGATRAKDTTTVKTGTRSLKIDSAGAGDGVQSAQLRNMHRAGAGSIGGSAPNLQLNTAAPSPTSNMFATHVANGLYNVTISDGVVGNNGTFPITSYVDDNSIVYTNGGGSSESGIKWATDEPYELVFWAYNAGSNTWDVKVDRGDGSFTTIGTIPPNGGTWTQYHFTFTLLPGDDSTNPRYLQIVDPNGGETIYVDGLHVFRSLFEYRPGNQYGVDGILTNPDQFSTAGSYSPGAADVGKWLFIWDPNTGQNGNSGWFKIITDLGGGSVQVDMRSPTASFISQGGLNYRIVDIENEHPNSYAFRDEGCIHCGFGIESPHTSKQRFFLRQYQNPGQVTKGSTMWGAPEDTDFNVDSGTFFKSGPSTQKNRSGEYEDTATNAEPTHKWRGGYTYKTTPTVSRYFLMTDADASFFAFAQIPDDGANGFFFFGYTGADTRRPGVMEWAFMSKFATSWSSVNDILWDKSDGRYAFSQFTTIDDIGEAVETSIAQLRYGTDWVMIEANDGPNPFSGREWLQKLNICVDPGGETGRSLEADAQDCGMYMIRRNFAPLTTFENEDYLHVDTGLVWEWSGEQIIP